MQKLPKKQRLRGRERFDELFRDGNRAGSGAINARALPNGTGESRLAAVAGKALGNAVKRNRMRRRIRAAFRMQRAELPAGWDFALLAKAGLLEAAWRDVMRDVRTAAERAAREMPCGPRQPRPKR